VKEHGIFVTSGDFFCVVALVCALYVTRTGPVIAAPVTQASIDLSGDWVLDEAYVSKAGPRQPFCGRACQITQDDKTLRVKVGTTTVTYRLDGTPVKSVTRSGEYASELVVTARWEDRRLVIGTKVGKGPERKFIVSIEEGKLTVLSTTRGFEMSPLESKVTYTRRHSRLLGQRP